MKKAENQIKKIIKKKYLEVDYKEGFYTGLFNLTREKIFEGQIESELKIFFEMLNNIGKISNDQVRNILEVGFLELLTDTKFQQIVCYKYLKGKSLEIYNALFESKFRKLID